jgi:putative proteasome-type protease
MTYAVALRLERGLVFAADTRTNAGVDNIAQYRKLQIWRRPGDRVFVLMSAGNLAITQTVVSLLNEPLSIESEDTPNLYNAANMYRAARVVGDAIREARHIDGEALEAADDTPFFQIGEHKYGKPILDRVARSDMRLGEAAKLILLSFDSTLRSNLSVGMPIDLVVYERDTLDITREIRIGADDAYFRSLSSAWSEALRHAFTTIEEFKV